MNEQEAAACAIASVSVTLPDRDNLIVGLILKVDTLLSLCDRRDLVAIYRRLELIRDVPVRCYVTERRAGATVTCRLYLTDLHASAGAFFSLPGCRICNHVTRFGIPLTAADLVGYRCDIEDDDKVSDPAEYLSRVAAAHKPAVEAVTDWLNALDDDAYVSRAAAATKNARLAYPRLDMLKIVRTATAAHLQTPLKPYQFTVAAWAIGRERLCTTADALHIQSGTQMQCVVGSRDYHRNSKPGISGGLIWDEMGMGKTLETLAIVVADADTPRAPGGAVPKPAKADAVQCFYDAAPAPPVTHLTPGGTLVVVPLSLLGQWQQEVAKHTRPGSLSTALYHGASRSAAVLPAASLIVTTYDTLVADERACRQALKRIVPLIRWRCIGEKHTFVPYKCPPGAVQPYDVLRVKDPRLGDAFYVVGPPETPGVFRLYMGRDLAASPCSLNGIDFKRPLAMPARAAELVIGKVTPCFAEHVTGCNTSCSHCRTDAEAAVASFARSFVLPPVAGIHWHRIVLDEIQRVSLTAKRTYEALDMLVATRRWCLSGTPFPAAFHDMRPALDFLGLPVLSDALRQYHLNQGVLAALEPFATRHCKADMLTHAETLPPVTYHTVPVVLNTEDRALYDEAAARTVAAFREWDDTSATTGPQRSVLARRVYALLRAQRQLCTLASAAVSTAAVVVEETPAVVIEETPTFECAICLETVPETDGLALMCRHMFCVPCLSVHLQAQTPRCALCMRQLPGAEIGEMLHACERRENAQTGVVTMSEPAVELPPTSTGIRLRCKFDALATILKREGGPFPTLVFCHFDATVHMVAELVRAETAYKPYVLTGSMSRAGRAKSIAGFEADQATVLVLSIRAAAYGLNLVHGCQVVFMEPTFVASLESQAVNRVLRLGQQRPVHVYYLETTDTLEPRIRASQALNTDQDTCGVATHTGVTYESTTQRAAWMRTRLHDILFGVRAP